MTDDRTQATYERMLEHVRETGAPLSGDERVGAITAARLLGQSCRTLENGRADGKGPPFYRIGGPGHRISYRLSDLAEWVESHRGTHEQIF